MTSYAVRITLPIRTVSEANVASHEHWRKRHRRATEQRAIARLWVTAALAGRPTMGGSKRTIRLTRIAPRRLDSDNLASAMKAIRDGIADALGTDDGDARIDWLYLQEKGPKWHYSVRIELEPH